MKKQSIYSTEPGKQLVSSQSRQSHLGRWVTLGEIDSTESVDYFSITYEESIETFLKGRCLYLKLDVTNPIINLGDINLISNNWK